MSMYGEHTRRPVVICPPGRAKQSMKEETEINNILSRYVKTGMISHLARGVPTFQDVSEVGDYRTAIDNVRAARDYFMTLPAAVRQDFDNDPAAFIDFLTHPSTDVDALRERALAALDDQSAEPAVPEPDAPE